MNTSTSNLESKINEPVKEIASRAANHLDQALDNTKRHANEAIDHLQQGVQGLRDQLPSALERTSRQVEALARRGVERARETSAAVRESAHRTGERTTQYIQDEPIKSVLIAAATGAGVALLVNWLSRSRDDLR